MSKEALHEKEKEPKADTSYKVLLLFFHPFLNSNFFVNMDYPLIFVHKDLDNETVFWHRVQL